MNKQISLNDNAQLYRSAAKNASEIIRSTDELIGEGSIEKMARLALSDPDGEFWRYSIWAPTRWYRDREIKQLMEIIQLLKKL